MDANDSYPMVVPDAAGSRVFIEVFDLDESKVGELDALEAPYDYWRESVHLREWGREAAIYVHAGPPPEGFTKRRVRELAAGAWVYRDRR